MLALADNLRRLRRQAGLTQAQLAVAAGLPRATLASLEQPDANPSVQVVAAVARALRVGVDDLLSPTPERRLYLVGPREQQEYRADHARFVARLVSPIAAKGIDINRISMRPGCSTVGRPHPEGAQEFFHCLAGTATLRVADETVEVPAGSLLQFPGHYRHSYENRGQQEVEAVSVVVLRMS